MLRYPEGVHSSQAQLKADAVIVGAGPAGLACAIRLSRRSAAPRRIFVLEKSAQPGGHLLSGAVLRPDALKNLLTPDEFAALPLGPVIGRDSFHALTPSRSFRLPFVPPKMRMKGLPLVSASALGRALAQIATKLGVEILTGQTADALAWAGDRVAGVATAGETILSPFTVLAEGPAGLLSRELFERHPELRGRNRQTHGLGLKEIVEIPADPDAVGSVAHTFGYPLGLAVYGGGFIYHFDATHVALGLALALDYADPSVQPHELFRRWKRHPLVQAHVAGGRAIEYGARLVPEGGWHSLARLEAPGAFVIGDSAGLVDTMELKGLHLAVESGMAAADAILRGGPVRMEDIPSLEGLRRTANYRAAFRAGLPLGMAAAGLAWLSGGRAPWGRIAQRDERAGLRPGDGQPPSGGAPDNGPLDLGMDSDLFLAHLRHREGSEHIEIQNPAKCRECFQTYAAPCLRFCPAAVYAAADDGVSIRVRPDNCVQCRCCTLKCPFDNIRWETPQHGVGPDYRNS
ncbi:MAG: FAD-binding protein [Opitutae bacterium]|nr:FAD-binding protein [Opitutae bacterium]